MQPPKALGCSLWIIWFACCTAEVVADDNDPVFDVPVSESTIIVVIHPSTFAGDGLLQSWPWIDEPLGQRRIMSRPQSTVEYELRPNDSIAGALLQIEMSGSSVGESRAHDGRLEIVSNSVTQYRAFQTLLIEPGGISFSPPAITQLNSNQSYNRVESPSGRLSEALVRIGFERTEDRLKPETNAFAVRQILQQIALRNQTTANNFRKFQSRFRNQYPLASQLPWQWSSDSHHIYLSTNTHLIESPPPNVSTPLTFLVTENTVAAWLSSSLGGGTLTPESMSEAYSQLSRQLDLPELPETDSTDEWVIQLAANPIKIKLKDNKLSGELLVEEYSAGDRTLKDIAVAFEYDIIQSTSGWMLRRTEDLEVESQGTESNTGARQQVLRTLMRNRIDKFFPDQINFPEFDSPLADSSGQLSFKLNEVSANDGWLSAAFDKQ